MEIASYHPSGAQNFEVAPRFLMVVQEMKEPNNMAENRCLKFKKN
jgi:hypothetical protein